MKRLFWFALTVTIIAYFAGCGKDENGGALPFIETGRVTDITPISVTVEGNVKNDGGSLVTERGVFYGTSPDTETTGTKISAGTGEGFFSAELDGLQEGTEYYVRAFATNSAGTAYGSELRFTANDILPAVSTIEIIEIESRTAIVRADISDDGGNQVTERGVYIGTDPDPFETGEKVSSSRGKGAFNTTVEGLVPETTYYVVAYGLNGVGKGFGEEMVFETKELEVLDSVTFTYNNRELTYGAVEYNNRIWLDRNLGADRPAESIDDEDAFGDLFQWGRRDDGHQQRNSSTVNIQTLSGFQPGHDDFIVSQIYPHDWNVDSDWVTRWTDDAENRTEADPCPEGWRVPTRDEWQQAASGWNTHEDLFNSPLRLPSAGKRGEYEGKLSNDGDVAYYWSTTPQSQESYFLYADSANVITTDNHRAAGFSVRCIKIED